MLLTRASWAVLFLAVGLGYRGDAVAAEAARPNILWLSCEDISPHLGCYGDANAITPTLDRLAAEGVRYSNAFTVAGVCAPNRTAIITGMYQTSIGGHHMRCKATLPESIRCFPVYLAEAGYYCTNNSKTDYNFHWPRSVWHQCSGKAHWRNRPAGKPFFAVFNYTGTHEGRIRATGDAYDKLTQRLTPDQRQDPDKLTLPPYYPDTPVTRNDWKKNYELITGMDYWVADMLGQLEADGLADETIVFFWSDHGVGLPRAKRWLYDSGTHVPLIIRIPERFRVGDQGAPGTVDDQLISSVDLAPTVLNLAGVRIPAYMQGRAFLGKNLTPPRQYVYGARDRMDERYDIIRAVRDRRYRYIRNYESYKAYYQYMNTPEGGPTMQELRRLDAAGRLPPAAKLFMAECKPVEELYDLENDPYEIHNLADSAEHQGVLTRMRAAHVKWFFQTKDLGLIPEPEIVCRTEKYGSAHAILQQPGAEKLLARLREVVAAGEEGKTALPKLIEAMHDEDAAVRYWGATGLGNLAHAAAPAAGLLAAALKDDSPSVRIASARALCLMDKQNAALGVLIRQLKSDRQWVRLAAALALDEIGQKARPAIDALEQALEDKENKYVVRVANHALNVLQGTNRAVR